MTNPYAWERDYSTWYPAYYSGHVDEGEQPAVGDDSYEFAKLDTWEYGGGAGAINPYYDAYYYNRRFHPGANEGGIPDSERTKVAIDMFFLLASAYFVMFMLLPLVCACRIFPQEHRRMREIQAVVDGSRKVFELDDSGSNVTGLGKHADDEPVCTMCLEPFAAGCTTSTLPCGHSFHSDCIKRWLVTTSFVVRTCPICRANPLRSPEERHDMSMHEEDGSLPICPPCPVGTNCHNWCSRWWASTSGGSSSSTAAPTAAYPLMLRHVDLV